VISNSQTCSSKPSTFLMSSPGLPPSVSTNIPSSTAKGGVVLRQAELRYGAEHAVRQDAAELAGFDPFPAGRDEPSSATGTSSPPFKFWAPVTI
jgi:hypothetical protein